jgi:CheY-like chemotaxis protein
MSEMDKLVELARDPAAHRKAPASEVIDQPEAASYLIFPTTANDDERLVRVLKFLRERLRRPRSASIARNITRLSPLSQCLYGEATMAQLRVLVVEDERVISLLIEDIVQDTISAVVIVKSSAQEAKAVLDDPIHFALLDVDVTNGKTYDVARLLVRKQIPFVFVSGSLREELPPELQGVPFIAKPFADAEIRDAVMSVDDLRFVMRSRPP